MTEDGTNSDGERRAVSARRFEWLRGETSRWRGAGVITTAQERAILDLYEPGTFGRHAATFALWALALVMAAMGVLLVIGYNWDQMPRLVKAALILGAVAASFGGSAVAYAREHPRAGELLGFLGVLLYGNAIWLLAQVFHISGHYPDGMMWWMIGALLVAHLLDSPITAALGMVLLGSWVWMEAVSFGGDTLLFVVFAAVALRLAYRFQQRTLLAGCGALFLLWIGAQWIVSWQVWPPVTVGVIFAAGAAAFATGLLHHDRSPMRLTWVRMGGAYMLIGLLPLMVKEFHRIGPPGAGSLRWPQVAVGILLIVYAWLAGARRRALAEALPVLVAALLVATGLAAAAVFSPEQGLSQRATWALAIGFSALAVALAVVLLRAGIRMDDARLFAVGVLIALSFLVVRWIDLIGNMLWSALLLFTAAAALILLARMWRQRRPAAGRGGA
ncbi:MAG TPA: DUF2157 domain-containing protein [Vicinamibacterales bacterium]|nr:DUF2157 domain-containing protein [Vicinamibacterales bacterium]